MAEFAWEDALTERKTENDLKDLRKTLVAFANTVRPGHTARILIGERDDGTVQGVKNADNIQRKVREECEEVYPPIIWRQRVYEKDEKSCVEVEIEYSGETPHFGSPAWVRIGSEQDRSIGELLKKTFRLPSNYMELLDAGYRPDRFPIQCENRFGVDPAGATRRQEPSRPGQRRRCGSRSRFPKWRFIAVAVRPSALAGN
jgi:hypothetical protein